MTDSTTKAAEQPSPLVASSSTQQSTQKKQQQRQQQHQQHESNKNKSSTTPTATAPLSSFLAGFAGGSASTILLYPLDLIKVRMQVDERRRGGTGGSAGGSGSSHRPSTNNTTKPTTSCTAGAAANTATATNTVATDKPRTICTTVRGVIRHEGYLGLYRGLTPAIIGSAASWGGFFILYEQMKRQMLLRKQAKNNNDVVSNNDSLSTMTMTTMSNEEKYDLTKDMHVDEEMDVNTNTTSIKNANTTSNMETQQPVKLGPIEHFSASCLAGACMVALTNPIWLIKTRLQLQNSNLEQQLSQLPQTTVTAKAKAMTTTTTQQQQIIKPAYRGLIHAASTIVQEEGVLALYKGSVPALMLVSHGGIQFVTYEFLKGHFANFMKSNDKSSSSGNQWKDGDNDGMRKKGTIGERMRNSLGYLVMGAASKFVASTTTYPLQVIKARLQQRSQVVELSEAGEIVVTKREYSGVWDCVGKISRNEGFGGFFKGCLTNAIRVAPSAAITFVTYEFVLDVLTEDE